MKITQEYLKSILDYDQHTGVLKWRPRPRESFLTNAAFFSFNTLWAGKEAGTATGRHKSLPVLGKLRLNHRMIWIMVHGSIPDGMYIDHVNGDGLDNRLENLRLATPAQNSWNSSSRTDGHKNVNTYNQRGKRRWRARIAIGGRRVSLGLYDSKEAAIAAYRQAAESMHGEFACFRKRNNNIRTKKPLDL